MGTVEGRRLLSLFIQYGRKPNVENYVITCGDAAIGLGMPRNLETLAWLKKAACNLWCGARIDSNRVGCKGVNYVRRITVPRILDNVSSKDIKVAPQEVWGLELILGVRVSLFHAMQKWFYAPDIPVEVWNCVSDKATDFFSKVLEKHNNTTRFFQRF